MGNMEVNTSNGQNTRYVHNRGYMYICMTEYTLANSKKLVTCDQTYAH